MKRREFTQTAAASLLAWPSLCCRAAAESSGYQPRWLLASCMYGTTSLKDILSEVRPSGAEAIDIWPRVHGNQREQIEDMGEEAFADLLQTSQVRLGCLTQYPLGPFGLKSEFAFAERFGCPTIVTGGRGPKGLKGTALKNAVAEFVEQLKPHLEDARRHGVTIAIENHGSNLIESADALRWMIELCEDDHLGVALAPYHLPQDAEQLAGLIKDLGNRIRVFYAWQHGMGCMTKLPKEQELLQMPGRGSLDFRPLMEALRAIDYDGWTEIFMHPVPRGVPILDSTSAVTEEINRARVYLEACLASA